MKVAGSEGISRSAMAREEILMSKEEIVSWGAGALGRLDEGAVAGSSDMEIRRDEKHSSTARILCVGNTCVHS